MKQTQGNLSETNLPRLLDAIYRQKDPAGVLEIVKEPVKKRFYFKDGRPVFATSNVLGEVLGRLLMDEGIINQAQYQESLEKVIEERKRHGEVLISMGLLTQEKLDELLTLQLKRRLWKIFGWEEGSWRYVKAEDIPENLSQYPLHPGKVVLDGINLGFFPSTKAKEELKGYLAEPLELSAKSLELYPPEDLCLNLQEKRFLKSFDGERTLKQVLEGSDLLTQRTISLALCFIITGVARPAGQEDSEDKVWKEVPFARSAGGSGEDTRLNAELIFMKARSALQNNDFSTALDLLEQITELNPVEGEYWAYLGWAKFKENPAKVREAEKIIKDAIDLNNELDQAWYFLGMTSLESGDRDWAKKSFKKALEKNPWNTRALAELKRLETMELAPEDRERTVLRKRYMEYYSFREDPFSEFPRPGYLPLTGSQAEALGFLSRGIRKKTEPLLLMGPRGGGKTTIALKLLYELAPEKILCVMVLKPPAAELDFIWEVNTEAGSTTEAASVKEQLLSLGMRLSQNRIQGGHSVLIVDEAHTLSPICLKLIQYLSRLKTLQIVLLSGPEIEEKLTGPGMSELNGKLASRHTIEPLTIEQTHNYITARLEKASLGEPFTLEYEAVKAVYDRSRGVPSMVNRFASVLLAAAAGLETRSLDEAAARAAFGEAAGPAAAGAAQKQAPAADTAGAEPSSRDNEAAPVPSAPPSPSGAAPEAPAPDVDEHERAGSGIIYAVVVLVLIIAALVAGAWSGVLDLGPWLGG